MVYAIQLLNSSLFFCSQMLNNGCGTLKARDKMKFVYASSLPVAKQLSGISAFAQLNWTLYVIQEYILASYSTD